MEQLNGRWNGFEMGGLEGREQDGMGCDGV